MKINKIYRLCITTIIFFGSIVLSMALLQVPFIKNLLSPSNIYSISGVWLWVTLWLIITLECAIIPGPYIPFLLFFSGTPLAGNKLLFWGICTSAVVIGRIGAYFIGGHFGNKLLKWVAEDSYIDWQKKLDAPVGKTFYLATVAAPFFPDFVLAIIAGSIKMNFWFYIIVNTIFKSFENLLLIYLGVTMSGGGSLWFYIYLGIIIINLIVALVLKIIINKAKIDS